MAQQQHQREEELHHSQVVDLYRTALEYYNQTTTSSSPSLIIAQQDHDLLGLALYNNLGHVHCMLEEEKLNLTTTTLYSQHAMEILLSRTVPSMTEQQYGLFRASLAQTKQEQQELFQR